MLTLKLLKFVLRKSYPVIIPLICLCRFPLSNSLYTTHHLLLRNCFSTKVNLGHNSFRSIDSYKLIKGAKCQTTVQIEVH